MSWRIYWLEWLKLKLLALPSVKEDWKTTGRHRMLVVMYNGKPLCKYFLMKWILPLT
jgi:hypothetical protein